MGFLDMLNHNTVPRLKFILYIVLVCFSFLIFVGVAVMKEKIPDCPLYSKGDVSNCNYPMAISIIFQIFYALFRITIIFLLLLGKLTPEMFLFSNIMEFVYLGIDAVAFFLTLIAACILSHGHNESFVPSWEKTWIPASEAAQAGAWLSLIVWLALIVISVLYMVREGKIPFCVKQSSETPGYTSGDSAVATPHIEAPPNNPDNRY